MGAFWDAWDKQDQLRNQSQMSQIQQATGLAGLMQKAQEQQQVQAVRGLLANGDVNSPELIPALLRAGPAGIDAANKIAVMQEHQQKVAKTKRVEDFWKNEAPKFNTPATPAVMGNQTPTGGLLGFQSGEQEDAGPQGMLSPPKPAGVDLEGLLNRGAQVGAVNPEALVNHRAQQEQRREAVLAREREWQAKLADTKLSREERRTYEMQRDRERQEDKEFNIRLAGGVAAAGRQPAPLVVVSDGKGGWKYEIRENAVGAAAPAPSADIRVDAGAKTWAAREVKNFKADPEVKRFESFAPPVEAIAPYMTRMAKPGATSDNVEDLNLTKLYLGITQQKGERLTNMDKKGLSALAPLDARFGNAISSFLGGKDLTDDVRKGMWKTVVGQMATLQQVKDARKAELLKRAEANKVDKALLFGSTEE